MASKAQTCLIGHILFLVLVSFLLSIYCVSVCSHIGYNSAAPFHRNVSFLVNPPYLTPNHVFTNTLPYVELEKSHKYSMHSTGTNPDLIFIFTEPTPLFFFQERCMYGLGSDRLMYKSILTLVYTGMVGFHYILRFISLKIFKQTPRYRSGHILIIISTARKRRKYVATKRFKAHLALLAHRSARKILQ